MLNLQGAVVRRQRLQRLERLADQHVRRQGTSASTAAWLLRASGGQILIERGILCYHGVGVLQVQDAAVDVTGGTAGAPGWVCLVLAPGSITGWTVGWQADAPSLQDAGGWHFPVARAYLAGGRAVLSWAQRDIIHIGAFMR